MHKELPFVSSCLETVAAGLTKGDWIVLKEGDDDGGNDALDDNDPIWVGGAEVNPNKSWKGCVKKVSASRKKHGVLDPRGHRGTRSAVHTDVHAEGEGRVCHINCKIGPTNLEKVAKG